MICRDRGVECVPVVKAERKKRTVKPRAEPVPNASNPGQPKAPKHRQQVPSDRNQRNPTTSLPIRQYEGSAGSHPGEAYQGDFPGSPAAADHSGRSPLYGYDEVDTVSSRHNSLAMDSASTTTSTRRNSSSDNEEDQRYGDESPRAESPLASLSQDDLDGAAEPLAGGALGLFERLAGIASCRSLVRQASPPPHCKVQQPIALAPQQNSQGFYHLHPQQRQQLRQQQLYQPSLLLLQPYPHSMEAGLDQGDEGAYGDDASAAAAAAVSAVYGEGPMTPAQVPSRGATPGADISELFLDTAMDGFLLIDEAFGPGHASDLAASIVPRPIMPACLFTTARPNFSFDRAFREVDQLVDAFDRAGFAALSQAPKFMRLLADGEGGQMWSVDSFRAMRASTTRCMLREVAQSVLERLGDPRLSQEDHTAVATLTSCVVSGTALSAVARATDPAAAWSLLLRPEAVLVAEDAGMIALQLFPLLTRLGPRAVKFLRFMLALLMQGITEPWFVQADVPPLHAARPGEKTKLFLLDPGAPDGIRHDMPWFGRDLFFRHMFLQRSLEASSGVPRGELLEQVVGQLSRVDLLKEKAREFNIPFPDNFKCDS